MCSQFDIIAKTESRVSGTVRIAFAAFQDAPTEKSFWGQLVLNGLAGLAVVAVAALIVGSGGLLGPVVFGGCMVVGMMALSDIASYQVSSTGDYVLGAIKGCISGAIFGGLNLAGQFAGKFIACDSIIGAVIPIVAKGSTVISLGIAGFDLTVFTAELFFSDNAYTNFNENAWYNGFQWVVSLTSAFTLGANSTMVCFVAGTPILTPLGLVAIEKIKAGDKVISTNTDTFETAEKLVLENFIHKSMSLVHIWVEGHKTSVTPNHPYWS